MTPADRHRERVASMLPDELHALAMRGSGAEALAALQEIAARKGAQRYRLPAIDSERVARFLIVQAAREFGYVFPPVSELLVLLDRRRRFESVPYFLPRAAALLRRAYAGSDAKLPQAPAETQTAPAAEPRAPSKWDDRADLR